MSGKVNCMAQIDPFGVLAALASVEKRQRPTNPANLRQYARSVVRGDAELHPMDEDVLDRTPIRVQLRDVSLVGMGFLCQERLDINSRWRIDFLKRGHVIGQQSLIVRHREPVGDDLFLLGGQFVADTGLLMLLGADLSGLPMLENAEPTSGDFFLPPGEVA